MQKSKQLKTQFVLPLQNFPSPKTEQKMTYMVKPERKWNSYCGRQGHFTVCPVTLWVCFCVSPSGCGASVRE